MRFLFITLLFTCRLQFITAEDKNCVILFKKCNAKYNCFANLINLKFFCHGLFSGEDGDGCTEGCKEAIQMLTSDKNGKDFFTCDCNLDAECLTYQARASKCMNNRTVVDKVGCATFSRQCEDDVGCNEIMEKFYLKCTHLISGTECTPKCETVQEELYSHNITKGLLNCECSGTLKEENFCRGIAAHTLHLCKTSPMVRKEKEKQRQTLEGNEGNNSKSKLNTLANVTSKSIKLGSERAIVILLLILKICYEMFYKWL